MMTVTIDIPALDRLCGILEQRDRGNILGELQQEITRQLEDASKDGTLRRAAEAPTPACERCADYVTAQETAPEAQKPAQEPTKVETTEKPSASEAPAPACKPATLADIQKAAAQLRDDGKLQAVKDLFPEFGIRKLSDLKADQLQTFAERLRGMGAKV